MEFILTEVPEWEAEDELSSVLAEEEMEKASLQEAKEMLEKIRIQLPPRLEWCELKEYTRKKNLPWSLQLPPHGESYSYYFVEVPLNILLPEKYRLVRLRLVLEMSPEEAVAYDLFPSDEIELQTLLSGEISLDISKALRFVPAVGEKVSQCLGFKLSMPFKWQSPTIYINTSDRLSNPAEWYVRDRSIQKGFTAFLIVQSPQEESAAIDAHLYFEIRERGWLEAVKEKIVKKACFKSASPRKYLLR